VTNNSGGLNGSLFEYVIGYKIQFGHGPPKSESTTGWMMDRG